MISLKTEKAWPSNFEEPGFSDFPPTFPSWKLLSNHVKAWKSFLFGKEFDIFFFHYETPSMAIKDAAAAPSRFFFASLYSLE